MVWFSSQIHMARQTALGQEPMDSGEKSLQSGKGLGSLQPSQFGRPLFARVVPTLRNRRLLIGGVFRRVAV